MITENPLAFVAFMSYCASPQVYCWNFFSKLFSKAFQGLKSATSLMGPVTLKIFYITHRNYHSFMGLASLHFEFSNILWNRHAKLWLDACLCKFPVHFSFSCVWQSSHLGKRQILCEA